MVKHPGFEVTARAADGTIEAMEDPERPFWLGVQWHPESGDDHGLFLGLVEAAAQRGSPRNCALIAPRRLKWAIAAQLASKSSASLVDERSVAVAARTSGRVRPHETADDPRAFTWPVLAQV